MRKNITLFGLLAVLLLLGACSPEAADTVADSAIDEAERAEVSVLVYASPL